MAALDSLRGVAIVAVIVSHCGSVLRLEGGAGEALVQLGRGGVTLFFLLSGYLIFRNLQSQSLRSFFCRRFFKVMPAYWGNIAVILAADLCFSGMAHYSAPSYLASFFASTDLLGIQAVSGVLWTLLIEIKFYVFIGLQFALFRTRHVHAVLAALLALEGAAWVLKGHGSLMLAYFPVFYAGIEIQLAEAAGWRRPAVWRLAAVTAVLAASLALFLDQLPWASAAYLVASVLLFVLFLKCGLSHRLADFLGRTSYSNYLYHSMIAGALFSALDSRILAERPGIVFVAALLLSTAGGTLLYAMVEVPMVKLGRRLAAK